MLQLWIQIVMLFDASKIDNMIVVDDEWIVKPNWRIRKENKKSKANRLKIKQRD